MLVTIFQIEKESIFDFQAKEVSNNMFQEHTTSIVIVTYNQLGYTEQCVESIRRYTKPNTYEIIVVDNNSTDGTLEWLNKQNDIKVVRNTENKGYTIACNQGMRIAGEKNILLLNNDVFVTNNWLNNLLICLYCSEKVGAVGPVTNNCSYYQVDYQRISTNYKSPAEMQLFAEKHNISNPLQWESRLKLIGFCFLFKREVMEKIGLLDERYCRGHYADDDYSFRIREAGYTLTLCKDTFIHHFGGISFKVNPNILQQSVAEGCKLFEEKWGFNAIYHTNIRYELINLMEKCNVKPNVLEIGCGCGGTLLYISSRIPGASLFGIEINASAANIAKSFADITVADVEKIDFPYANDFFDIILLPDVLEHLRDPWYLVQKLKKHLKPQTGIILASIPNVMHFSVLNNLLNGHWKYEESGIMDKTHLRFFTFREIGDLFFGYTIEKIAINNSMPDETEKVKVDMILNIIDKDLREQVFAVQYLVSAKI